MILIVVVSIDSKSIWLRIFLISSLSIWIVKWILIKVSTSIFINKLWFKKLVRFLKYS